MIGGRVCLLMVMAVVSAMPVQAEFPGDEWTVATPASQGLDAAKLDQAREWLASHNSKSGLVIRHGKIVGEWYFGGAEASSKFAAYSTTKSLSSMATGLAIADGKLALTDTVGKYRPDAQPDAKKNVTVRQLLSMTTGVHNDSGVHQRDNLFTYALQQAPMDHEPGSKWDYNNTGLSLLSPVFAKATGRQIDEFLTERVFRKIGIADRDVTWERREGLAIPYSGCHTTARAMGRIGLLVRHEGSWNGQQIVPAEWLRESIVPSQDLNRSYGYLWWNNTTGKWPKIPRDAYAALGRWDNNIFVVPSLDLIVIRQSDLAPGPDFRIVEYYQRVCEAIQDKAADK